MCQYLSFAPDIMSHLYLFMCFSITTRINLQYDKKKYHFYMHKCQLAIVMLSKFLVVCVPTFSSLYLTLLHAAIIA
jgi:hypothetical protein